MIIEFYIATILVCGLTGDCTYHFDKLGPVKTREECQVRLDGLWERILVAPSVTTRFPRMKRHQADHQGMCLDNTKKDIISQQRELWYVF